MTDNTRWSDTSVKNFGRNVGGNAPENAGRNAGENADMKNSIPSSVCSANSVVKALITTKGSKNTKEFFAT